MHNSNLPMQIFSQFDTSEGFCEKFRTIAIIGYLILQYILKELLKCYNQPPSNIELKRFFFYVKKQMQKVYIFLYN